MTKNPAAVALGRIPYFEDRGVKLGEPVRLYFAGGPCDMPRPWIAIRLEEKYSSVNGKLNPIITVRASNGVERTYDRADYYSPVPEGDPE